MILLRRITTTVNMAVVFIGSIGLATLPLIVFYDVTARYVFNAPTIWANEISVYLLQLMVFLSMGVLLADDGHVRSTLLTDRLSPATRAFLRGFSLVVVAGFAGVMTWLGWSYTAHAWRFGQVSATLLEVPL